MNSDNFNTILTYYEELNGELPVYTREEWINQYGLHPMSFANI